MADEEKKGKKKVQDAYTLRCIPQVHGVVHDTLKFVRGILKTEMNSATDNPVSVPYTLVIRMTVSTFAKDGAVRSGENCVWWKLSWGIPWKGTSQILAVITDNQEGFATSMQVLDYLAIAVHELANISERRIDRLTNHGKLVKLLSCINIIKMFSYLALNKILPGFLCSTSQEAGLNNGLFMLFITVVC